MKRRAQYDIARTDEQRPECRAASAFPTSGRPRTAVSRARAGTPVRAGGSGARALDLLLYRLLLGCRLLGCLLLGGLLGRGLLLGGPSRGSAFGGGVRCRLPGRLLLGGRGLLGSLPRGRLPGRLLLRSQAGGPLSGRTS